MILWHTLDLSPYQDLVPFNYLRIANFIDLCEFLINNPNGDPLHKHIFHLLFSSDYAIASFVKSILNVMWVQKVHGFLMNANELNSPFKFSQLHTYKQPRTRLS